MKRIFRQFRAVSLRALRSASTGFLCSGVAAASLACAPGANFFSTSPTRAETPDAREAQTSPHAIAPSEARLLVISIDGWAAFYRDNPQIATPNLDALRAAGVGGSCESVFPTMTWVAHTSLTTGVLPERHGVIGNTYFDRERGEERRTWRDDAPERIRVPTVFSLIGDQAAQESDSTRAPDIASASLRPQSAGPVESAAILWPLSNNDPWIRWNIPEVYGDDYFRRLIGGDFRSELRGAGIPVHKLAPYSSLEDLPLDRLARDITLHVIREHQPRMLFTHFLALDGRQHRRGPGGAGVSQALEAIDVHIGALLTELENQGLRETTTIMIVSDHGFFGVNRATDLNKYLARRGIIRRHFRPQLTGPQAEPVWCVANGHAAHCYLLPGQSHAERDPQETERLRIQAYEALARAPGVERVYLPQEYDELGLPQPGPDSDVGDLVVLAQPDWLFTPLSGRPYAKTLGRTVGMHGYLPGHPEMHSAFILSGAGVAPETQDIHVRLIDFAPGMAKLFGVAPEDFLEAVGEADDRKAGAIADRVLVSEEF